MINTVRCNNCMWEGIKEDLKIFTDLSQKEIEYFRGCPNCKTDEYLMDIALDILIMEKVKIYIGNCLLIYGMIK